MHEVHDRPRVKRKPHFWLKKQNAFIRCQNNGPPTGCINVFQNTKMKRLTSLIPYNSKRSGNTGDI
jgi:hypothetical protein